MTEEEKKAAEAQSKAEMDTLVERLGATIEERFTSRLEAAVKPLREKVESLETSSRQPAKAAEPTEPADPSLEPERWKRENLVPLAVQNILTNARLTENEVLMRVDPQWQHLLPEVRKYLDQTPVERKAEKDYPEYVQNCIDLAIGRAAKTAGVKYDSKGQRFFIESGGTGTGGTESQFGEDMVWVDRKGRRLRGEDQLAKLGIDPKEFAKGSAA